MLGLGVWASVFMSGLHATLAGVLTALFVPARVRIVPDALPQVIRRGADEIEVQADDHEPDAMDPDRVAIIGAIGGSLDAATAPLQRFERAVQPWGTNQKLDRSRPQYFSSSVFKKPHSIHSENAGARDDC